MQYALCYSGTRFLSTDVLVDSVLISFYAVLFMLERVCTFNLCRSFDTRSRMYEMILKL